MDIDDTGELNYNQVEEIIKNLSLTDIIRQYGQRIMESEEAAAAEESPSEEAPAEEPAAEGPGSQEKLLH